MSELYWQKNSDNGHQYAMINDSKDCFELMEHPVIKGKFLLFFNQGSLGSWPMESTAKRMAEVEHKRLKSCPKTRKEVLRVAVEVALKKEEEKLESIKRPWGVDGRSWYDPMYAHYRKKVEMLDTHKESIADIALYRLALEL